MASFHMMPGTDKARIVFRFRGHQYSRTVFGATERDAARAAEDVEEAIRDVDRGRLVLPDDADIPTFLFSGGKVAQRPGATSGDDPPRSATLAEVFATYAANLTADSKQRSSLLTEKVHRDHFLGLLGSGTPMAAIGLPMIQGYVDRRAAARIARDTIEKELATLLVIWKWAHKRGHLPEPPKWARKDLTLPKGVEKPPFQTWEQIEHRIKVEKLTGDAADAAWECLWLDQARTTACLSWVAEHATGRPFMHPMVAFAAYTGARRSEILRSERVDWDFAGGTVAIRQMKADTSRDFTRRSIAIHGKLAPIMRDWFGRCPGSRWAVSTMDGKPIGPRMATKYLRATLDGGPWGVLHGWHVFRHSLASNMASAGIDQRVIDQTLGHSTDDMSRRYRHLLPQARDHAINSLFRG